MMTFHVDLQHRNDQSCDSIWSVNCRGQRPDSIWLDLFAVLFAVSLSIRLTVQFLSNYIPSFFVELFNGNAKLGEGEMKLIRCSLATQATVYCIHFRCRSQWLVIKCSAMNCDVSQRKLIQMRLFRVCGYHEHERNELLTTSNLYYATDATFINIQLQHIKTITLMLDLMAEAGADSVWRESI